MKLLFSIYLVYLIFNFVILVTNVKEKKQSFLALKTQENFEDDFGDFNLEEQLMKEKSIKEKSNDSQKPPYNDQTNLEENKNNRSQQNKNTSKINKSEIKNFNYSRKEEKKEIKQNNIEKENCEKKLSQNISLGGEANKLISKLNPQFLQDLVKLQTNPVIQNLSHFYRNSNNGKQNSNQYSPIETKKEINVKVISKKDILDSSKLNYLENIINNMINEIEKKSQQNENYLNNNNNLERSYDTTNNQIIIYQSKLESILQEIKYINEMKNSLANQNSMIKETTGTLTETSEALKKNVDNLDDKLDKLDHFNEMVSKNIKNHDKEQEILVNKNIDNAKELEELKQKYESTGEKKEKLVKEIHSSFEKFDHQELKFLDIKQKENELDLDLKKEENTEKLLSLEIEHLKASNMLEIQKVEEMKQEIEKSKNMKENLQREIEELDEKLRSIERESKEKQIEYEIKKNEFEDKLNKAKRDINFLRKSKNTIITNNKIIPLDKLKEKKEEIPKLPTKEETINFIEKNSQETKDSNPEKGLEDLLKKNGINSLKDLEEKVNKFKSDIESSDEDNALKNQILSLINNIKN